MPIEIERKYLVNKTKWNETDKPQGQFFRQGYLLTDPNKTIRIRVTDSKGYLTIKGLSIGTTRPEFEYEIPKDEAEQLLNMFTISDLTKVRYKILVNENLWEVDEFLGDNEGLIVAEIELQSEEEAFVLPIWAEKEVTGEDKYYNSTLSILPYKNW